jgi:deazaflavin-dependent oxidoreductase (nitroreductase family)
MAESYRLTPLRRVGNVVIRQATRFGVGDKHTYLLTVTGRKSGKRYSTPVRLIEEDGERWLVSPYGERSWVKNARAAGRVELSRGGKTEHARIRELSPDEAAPIVRTYVEQVPIVRKFFDAGPDSPVEAFVRETRPVFRLQPEYGEPAGR